MPLLYKQEDSSTFIRKGVIFNLDKTAQSLTSIINRLEGELKNSIAQVYVGIGGPSLRTVRNVVSRDLEEEEAERLKKAYGDALYEDCLLYTSRIRSQPECLQIYHDPHRTGIPAYRTGKPFDSNAAFRKMCIRDRPPLW